MELSKKWSFALSQKAKKDFNDLEKKTQKRVYTFLEKLTFLDNPRTKAIKLSGHAEGYWRYRVGDYRIICTIHDSRMVILALEIGHRREVYR